MIKAFFENSFPTGSDPNLWGSIHAVGFSHSAAQIPCWFAEASQRPKKLLQKTAGVAVRRARLKVPGKMARFV